MNGLKLEYALEGTSNCVEWKDQMEEIFDDNGLLEYIKTNVTKAQAYGAWNLAKWKKYVANARRIILEGV